MENPSDQQSVNEQPSGLGPSHGRFNIKDPAIWTKMVYLLILVTGVYTSTLVQTDEELRILFTIGVVMACAISMYFWWVVVKDFHKAIAFAQDQKSTSTGLIENGATLTSVMQVMEIQRNMQLERFTERVVLRSNTLIMLGMIATALTIILGLPGILSCPPPAAIRLDRTAIEAPLGATRVDSAKVLNEEINNADKLDNGSSLSAPDPALERVLRLAPKAFAFTALALFFAVVISFLGNLLREEIRARFFDPIDQWKTYQDISSAVDENNKRFAKTFIKAFDKQIGPSLREMTLELQNLPSQLTGSVTLMQKASDLLAKSAQGVKGSFSEVAAATKGYFDKASSFSESLASTNSTMSNMTSQLSELQSRIETRMDETVEKTLELQTQNLELLKQEQEAYRKELGKLQATKLDMIKRELEEYRKMFVQEIPSLSQDVLEKLHAAMKAPLQEVATAAARKLSELGDDTITRVVTQWNIHLRNTQDTLGRIESSVGLVNKTLRELGGALEWAAETWRPLADTTANTLESLAPSLEELTKSANTANKALNPLVLDLEKMIGLADGGDGEGSSAFERLETTILEVKAAIYDLKVFLNETVADAALLGEITEKLRTIELN